MADGNDYTFNAMLRAAQRGSAWQRAWWLYNKAGRAPGGEPLDESVHGEIMRDLWGISGWWMIIIQPDNTFFCQWKKDGKGISPVAHGFYMGCKPHKNREVHLSIGPCGRCWVVKCSYAIGVADSRHVRHGRWRQMSSSFSRIVGTYVHNVWY